MKSVAILTLVAGNAAAFAPVPSRSLMSSVIMSDATAPVEIEAQVEEVKPVYPTVNGWTADPTKFCYGLPGALSPMGNFDPFGLSKDLPLQEIKRYREAEVTHGRVAMLATVGYLVAEKFHPFFGGVVSGPANSHLGQVREVAPAFFVWLTLSIATAELARAKIGWNSPEKAIKKNQELEFEGKTWLSKLNDRYYPGDIGFDPLGLKPTDPTVYAQMQTKELQNGRLAMLAAMGMIVQEQITHETLF